MILREIFTGGGLCSNFWNGAIDWGIKDTPTQEIFYSENIDYGWDGGDRVTGLYTYLILVVDKLGEFHKTTGTLLLE